VSEILIEDSDNKSHHTSLTMGDNIPLFNTLDNIHTFDDSSDTAAPNIMDPPTPDFTPTSVKTYTKTSTNIWNAPVEGESVNLKRQVDREDNQPVPRLDEPGPDDIDQTTTPDGDEVESHKPDIKPILIGDEGPDDPAILGGIQLPLAQPEKQGECGGKTASSGSGEVDWEIATVDDAKPIRHLYVGQIPGTELVLKLTDPKDQHLSNIVTKTKDLPPMGTTLADGPLEEPRCISSDQSRGGGGVSWSNPRKYRERTRPPTTLERHKVNPEKGDDAKSNPLPQPDFDGADPVLMPIDQNTTLLKD
jgi:hypothetical protein